MKVNVEVLTLIKQLARNLKYQELPELIGQSIMVHSFNTLYADISNNLNLPMSITPIEKDQYFIKGALAKYGFIDLRFTVLSEALTTASSGVSVLKDLSLVYTKEQFEGSFEPDDFTDAMELEFLKDVVEDIADNSSYLLLFLKADIPEVSTEARIRRFFQYMKSFPDDFFPKQFVIQDAALSNTKMAWMNKHFYP